MRPIDPYDAEDVARLKRELIRCGTNDVPASDVVDLTLVIMYALPGIIHILERFHAVDAALFEELEMLAETDRKAKGAHELQRERFFRRELQEARDGSL